MRRTIRFCSFIISLYLQLAQSLSVPASESSCIATNNNNLDDNSMTSSSGSKSLRSIRRILPQQPKHWVGDGFNVYPVFADLAFTNELSPFLMFDYAAPKKFTPITSSRRGVGQHPHRGFETVTIAFQGEVEHHDSTGNGGVIGPNDIQWMTAGRGIIHQEYHSTNFSKKGGVFEMCQLWVNLPKKNKMAKPNYQPILNTDVPSLTLPTITSTEDDNNNDNVGGGAKVRIIAGELNGTKGPANTFSPVELWDIEIPKANNTIDIPFKNGHNCIVFVRRGEIDVIVNNETSKKVEPQGVALMESSGDVVRIKSKTDNTSILIMGGEPLNEPIAARGPFVMNTFDEIQQANIDYRSGRFGT